MITTSPRCEYDADEFARHRHDNRWDLRARAALRRSITPGKRCRPPVDEDAMAQAVRKTVHLDGIQPHQPDIAQRRGELARVIELAAAVRRHGRAHIHQHAHRHARLHLEHLQEQLFQAQIGVPVHRPQIVAVMEIAMVEKFLARRRRSATVVPAHQPGERLLPVDGEPLEFLQKLAV